MTDGSGPARPGPMALVGSGEFLPAMEAVDAGLLAGRPRRVVFLPTAAGQEDPDRLGYWLRLGTDHYQRLGVEPVPLPVLSPGIVARRAAGLAGGQILLGIDEDTALVGGDGGWRVEGCR